MLGRAVESFRVDPFVVQPWYYAEFICCLTRESSDFRQGTERQFSIQIDVFMHCTKYLHKLSRNNLIYI